MTPISDYEEHVKTIKKSMALIYVFDYPRVLSVKSVNIK